MQEVFKQEKTSNGIKATTTKEYYDNNKIQLKSKIKNHKIAKVDIIKILGREYAHIYYKYIGYTPLYFAILIVVLILLLLLLISYIYIRL